VIEAGDWQLADGTRLSAGITNTSRLSSAGFENVAFANSFDAEPTVLSQTQTFTEADYVITRTKGINADGFDLTLQEEEALNGGTHATESIGWLAIDQGNATADGLNLQAGNTANTYTNAPAPVAYNSAFSSEPSLLAKVASFDGPDPSNLRISEQTTSGFTARVDEEQSADNETSHITESLAYIALSGSSGILQGTVYQPPVVFAEYGQLAANQNWQTIALSEAYSDPVVIVSDPSFNGADPVAVRLRNVGTSSFDIRLQEPNYKDGVHVFESLTYLVIEAGDWQLPDGTRLSAGITNTGRL